MNISGMQTNFANAISPFNPLGKQAVGQEETDSKESTLKPVEQSPEAFRSEEQKNNGDLIVDEKKLNLKLNINTAKSINIKNLRCNHVSKSIITSACFNT